MAKIKLLIVMGPSGCGKTTIAQALANRLSDGHYVEGDQLHPQSNIDKMSNAIPLDDDDRWPWLQSIRQHCENNAIQQHDNQYLIVTCSALKKIYRNQLRQIQHFQWIKFIFPQGSQQLIGQRIEQRKDHYMKANMLQSQFECFQPPIDENDVIVVDIEQSIDIIIDEILNKL
uniref:Gluconokinase n=1 Tax=Dermatophagoides pteronyssinus TaxID=6956 RepID=A0A6P6XZ56_DERPT|nr:probable gluconokinase isoform X1 [Dermatophagoides pteronyssinus]